MTTRPSLRGFTLVEVLVSLLILTFGLLGIARAYLTQGPAIVQADQLTQSAAAATAWWSVEQLQAVPQAWDSTQAVPGAFVPWFSTYSARLPGLRAVVTVPAQAQGGSCTAQSCQIALRLSWQFHGQQHTQSYVFQQGS